jgi:hypothetical protein
MSPPARKSSTSDLVQAAKDAVSHGFTPVPIRDGGKNPHVSGWTHLHWDPDNLDDVELAFARWHSEGASNLGLLLGTKGGGLVDVDLDNANALRLRGLLPPTQMRTGRAGRPMSHYWYVVEENFPGNRRFKMPDGSMGVELRASGSQTLVPPSIHPSGERYRWEGRKWGGESGPAKVDGRTLLVQTTLMALGVVLIEKWPEAGGRHEAFLALAGGLLRFGHHGIHPFWERNLPVLIDAIVGATGDEDGADARVKEVMGTTLEKLRAGEPAVGLPRLAEIIGAENAELARRYARDVESAAGFSADTATEVDVVADADEAAETVADLPPEDRDPLGERLGTWQPVDLDPYLLGEVRVPQPTVLRRSDGQGMFYEGRVNSLYGRSEAAKSWVALIACQQEMALGQRVMYLDFEDEPTFTIERLRRLGAGDDDVRHQFVYVRPEDPLMDMQRNRWGNAEPTEVGRRNHELFAHALETSDPSLIIVDGMTVLYGLHGLDSNDAVSTDIITTWLKRLCRNGRSTVLVIDHTGKGAVKGSSPIGAHHKIAMVQGTALQAHPIDQPMPGARGVIQLVVYKDRPGQVRANSTKEQPATAAVVILDSTRKDETHVEVQVPDPNMITVADQANDEEALRKAAERAEKERRKVARDRARTEFRAIVLAAFEAHRPESVPRSAVQPDILDKADPILEANERLVRQVIDELVKAGQLTRHGEGPKWITYAAV